MSKIFARNRKISSVLQFFYLKPFEGKVLIILFNRDNDLTGKYHELINVKSLPFRPEKK